MKTLILFSSLFLGVLSAQEFHVGVKGGVPLTHGVVPGDFDESRRYTVGPTFEVGLWRGFSIEVDGLYKRVGYSQSFSFAGVSSHTRSHGNSWEFPMLAKYTFGGRESYMRPFVEVGGNLRKIWNSYEFSQFGDPAGTPILSVPRNFDTDTNLQAGGTAGGGLLFRFGRFGVAPEARYTRWNVTNFPTNRNQAEFLVGIRF